MTVKRQNTGVSEVGYTLVIVAVTQIYTCIKIYRTKGLPGTVVKNPPANAGDTGSSPGPGRSHMPRSN